MPDNEWQRDRAHGEQLVVEYFWRQRLWAAAQVFPQRVDQRPAGGVTERHGGRLAVPGEFGQRLRARKAEFRHQPVRGGLKTDIARVNLDVDQDAQCAPQAVAQQDHAALGTVEKSFFVHQLLAVKRPALVKRGRRIEQARPAARRRIQVGGDELQMMPGPGLVHAGVHESDVVVLGQFLLGRFCASCVRGTRTSPVHRSATAALRSNGPAAWNRSASARSRRRTESGDAGMSASRSPQAVPPPAPTSDCGHTRSARRLHLRAVGPTNSVCLDG